MAAGPALPPSETTVGAASDGALVAPLGLRGPGYLHALERADARGRVALWQEIGDALGNLGRWDRARAAWERGRSLADSSPALRSLAASLYWRLGQLGEGMRELAEALGAYERAADIFGREGAHADEARARMAMARVVFHERGAGEAWRHAREAVLCARQATSDDAALLGEALELVGDIALDLGHSDEAIGTLRDALRQHERARVEGAGGGASGGLSSAEVRASVALAEALLDHGQSLAAVRVYESVEGLIEGHESLETRGRGMAILGLVNLELGKIEEAAEVLVAAHTWLEAAGSPLRRARLLVATAQRLERTAEAGEARVLYEQAWELAKRSGDELRTAPIGYALARLYLQMGELVLADDVIIRALRSVQNAGDLEGLARCTELGVRIAVRLAQGKLALERLILLARTRVRLGDRVGALRTMRVALEATLAVPDAETAPIAAEFMELLRETGPAGFGPTETWETAEALAKAGLSELACEIGLLEGERHLAEGRPSDAARAFAQTAQWSLQAKERWNAIDLLDRALEIGHQLGLPDVEKWTVDRTWAMEG